MPRRTNWNDVLRGATAGGTLGAAWGAGNPLAIVGGALVGGLSSAFGNDDAADAEEERQRRMEAVREALRNARNTAEKNERLANSGLVADTRKSAVQRAVASGRSGEAESYILPAQQSAIKQGSDNMRRIREYYDNANFNLEQDFANRPIEMNASFNPADAIETVSYPIANYLQNKQMLDKIDEQYSGNKTTNVVPETTNTATNRPLNIPDYSGWGQGNVTPDVVQGNNSNNGLNKKVKPTYSLFDNSDLPIVFPLQKRNRIQLPDQQAQENNRHLFRNSLRYNTGVR